VRADDHGTRCIRRECASHSKGAYGGAVAREVVPAARLELPHLALIQLSEAGRAKPPLHFFHTMEARRCRVQVRDEIGSRHGGPGGARRHRIPPDDEVLFLEYTPTMSAQIRSRHLSPRGTPRAPVAAAFGRSAGPGVIVTRACLHVARRRVTHAPTLTFPWLAVAQLGTPV